MSVITFVLFLLYYFVVKFSCFTPSVNNTVISITFVFFIYGAFLEIIQIPICILALFFKYRPPKIWFIFISMILFFIIKIAFFIYLLGAGV
ncbi:hypothetical protein C4F50_17865 [Flavobacterium sp. KB82]|uniref:Uncharacterized protein n=1 Tax=Flavobacterium hungaricum TaxID=2082725 RepID=A0ABR9TQ96_9FLAO|nr:hypothetical protein [Flavobacterium hungaricum]